MLAATAFSLVFLPVANLMLSFAKHVHEQLALALPKKKILVSNRLNIFGAALSYTNPWDKYNKC